MAQNMNMEKPGQRTCPRCGEAFTCGVAEAHCWCFDLPNVMLMDEAKMNEGCLCPACLRAAIEAVQRPQKE